MTSMQKTWALETISMWLNHRDKHGLSYASKMEQDILTILHLLVGAEHE